MNTKIKLGHKVRDRVSGLEGITTAQCIYLNGCIQFCVAPHVKEPNGDKKPDGHYVDVGQLEFVGPGVCHLAKDPPSSVAEVPGGNMSDAPPTSYCG